MSAGELVVAVLVFAVAGALGIAIAATAVLLSAAVAERGSRGD